MPPTHPSVQAGRLHHKGADTIVVRASCPHISGVFSLQKTLDPVHEISFNLFPINIDQEAQRRFFIGIVEIRETPHHMPDVSCCKLLAIQLNTFG